MGISMKGTTKLIGFQLVVELNNHQLTNLKRKKTLVRLYNQQTDNTESKDVTCAQWHDKALLQSGNIWYKH